ncbi:MAG TPA: hypothetical protein PK016_08690, partial [Candidatus Atribacteria bacterium]|nr:hypothetical protein [Candidatus Atribacteria bacterium]
SMFFYSGEESFLLRYNGTPRKGVIVNRKIHYKYYKGECPFIIPQKTKKYKRKKLLRKEKRFPQYLRHQRRKQNR